MCLWSVALKARKAAKWPRTFYMVWTVDFVGIKIFIIASAKIFRPWRPGRLEIGREHFIRV